MTQKPLIGLNMSLTNPDRDEPGDARLSLAYIDAVLKAGGVPVCLPPLEDLDAVRPLLSCLGGFLFVGGRDYLPHHYGGHPQPDHELMDIRRDRFDTALAELILEETDLPVLGVCGGLQLLAIVRGGGLIQDIATEWTPPGDGQPILPHSESARSRNGDASPFLHALKVEADGLLARATGYRPEDHDLLVNSYHHQAVDPSRPGRDLRATAWSADGVVEALEPAVGSVWARSGRFVLGVQWHPERMQDHASQQRLFRSFILAAAGSRP